MIKTYIQMVRPANVVTAWTDILAGASLVGFVTYGLGFAVAPQALLALLFATTGLYAGGIVLNDICDAELDAVERPERAIPSGRITLTKATIFSLALTAMGLGMSVQVGADSLYVAAGVAVCATLYNAWGKHQPIWGPINMGLCRAGNLMLGMTVLPFWTSFAWLAIFPLIYIAAITLISRGEVHGGKPKTLVWAGIAFGLVHLGQGYWAFQKGQWVTAITFILLHGYFVYKPLVHAYHQPTGPHMGQAVKAGVLGLILLNAAWISTGGDWVLASAVTFLLPLSMRLAKTFAVT